jgi:hypothetical protein
MLKERWHYLAVFYILFYALYYVLNYTITSAVGYNFELSVLLSPVFAATFLLIAYGLTRKSRVTWNWSIVGFRRKNLLKSFLWAMALISPITISMFVAVAAGYADLLIAFMSASYPSITPPVPAWYPLLAYVQWLDWGIFVFCLLEAFPYENLLEYPVKYRILVIWLLWSGLYGAPLLAPLGLGEVNFSDIIIFGFLFLVAYHESRNSIGLILAYVLGETPVWYISSLAWGWEVAIIRAIVLGLLSVVSIGVLAYQYLRPTKQP